MIYSFDNIPGYCSAEEAKIIYELIRNTPTSKILEAGCFLGKLTAGLSTEFQTYRITALDCWWYKTDNMFVPGNKWTDEKYIGLAPTHNEFKKFTHEYTNIRSIESDFLKFTEPHDIVILSLDAQELDWNIIIEHAFTVCTYKIVGRHAWFDQKKRTNMQQALNKYNTVYYDYGVYSINI